MNKVRYYICLLINNFEYCTGEVPLLENGTIKTFPTEDLAKEWVTNNQDYANSLYTIKIL